MNKNAVRIIMLTMAFFLILLITISIKVNNSHKIPLASTSQIINNSTNTPEEEVKATDAPITYKEVSILSVGDLIIHSPQLRSAVDSTTGNYDFNRSFKYVTKYIKDSDYSVINFETTLGGESVYPYSGSVCFNTPDSILDAVKNAGFKMLLLANNHTYDSSELGVSLTPQKARENGLDFVGVKESIDKKAYVIKDVNGVKIAFLNYAYESDVENTGFVWLNARKVNADVAPLIDTFNYNQKQALYDEVAARVLEVKSQGADAVFLYIHWGNEYNLKPNDHQTIMAENLSDAGVDVIIGSHPHNLQPPAVIKSKKTGKDTICFYSMGNFLSNQRADEGMISLTTGHTEDGAMLKVYVRKYSDGKILVSKLSYVPTWVNKYSIGNNFSAFEIMPLPDAYSDPDGYTLNNTPNGIERAKSSFKRTEDMFSSIVTLYNKDIILPYPEALQVK